MADSRDMFVVHDMFRREFNAIPGLVSEVPGEDGAQVTIVADHVVWMVTFLHAHHHGEDLFVWPKLLERVPVKIDPLIFTMKAQHKGLAQALDDLGVKAAGWRKTSAAAERDAVAGAATDLLGLTPSTWTSRSTRCCPSSTPTSPRRSGRRSAGRG
jgi:hypothetical protein